MALSIVKTDAYKAWEANETKKSKAQIDKRLMNIVYHNHFGMTRNLGTEVAELKFSDGRRIYYTLIFGPANEIMILLIGGNKNGQSKDIAQAKKIAATFRD